MDFARLSRCLRLAFLLGAVLGLLWGCSSSVEQKLKIAALSQDCLVNSDCADPLVCAFKTCHVQCKSSRDCLDGARCLAADHPYKVCQLDSERKCASNLDCPTGLVCGVDGECRDGCQTDFDCVPDQLCVAGTCADTAELDASGHLTPAPGMTAGAEGTPCVYVSDCSAALLCRNQSCLAQCKADVDCSSGETCQGTRCAVSGTAPKDCSYNSECDTKRGERCTSGACHCACVEDRDCPSGQLCDGCACQTDPKAPQACNYNSECAVSGQICRDNACSCACQADADCGADSRCDGCGCVSALGPVNGIVIGDVSIGSSLQLALYAGVVEIDGNLNIFGTHFASLGDTFAALKAVNGAIVFQNNQFVDLDAFPVLEHAGSVNFENESTLTSVSLPALKTASLSFYSMATLNAVSVPVWTGVALTVQQCSALGALSFPNVQRIGNVSIGSSPLTSVSFPKLTRADSMQFYNVAGSGGLVVDAPLSVEIDSLVFNSTLVKQLDSFDSSLHGSLATINNCNFTGNLQLSECAVQSLFNSIKVHSPDAQFTDDNNRPCTACAGAVCADTP